MTNGRPYYFMVTFWGERYRDFFYSLCLPTLLAPNNLPALRGRPGSKLIVCTTEQDWDALRSRPLFNELAKYVEPFVIYIPAPGKNDSPQLHMSYGHRLAMEKAYNDKAIAGFLAPDLLISDGLLAKAVALVDQGKKAVLCPALRYGMEPAFDRLNAKRLLRSDEPICLSSEFLSSVAVDSLHSEILRYDFEGPYFDNYPIWSFWRVPDRNGLVLYTVSWALLLGDYSAIANYDDEFLGRGTIDGFFVHQNFGHLHGTESMAFLNDSYDGVFLSLTSESELTYLPLRHIAINGRPLLGKLTRLLNMHRFHRSDVLDPFRRQAYAIPILIRGEAIDGRYEATVARSLKVMKFVADSPHIYFVGFEKFLRFCALLEASFASVGRCLRELWDGLRELWDDFRRDPTRVPERLMSPLVNCAVSLLRLVLRTARTLALGLIVMILLIIAPHRLLGKKAGRVRRQGFDIVDTHIIEPLVTRYGWDGTKKVIRRLPKFLVRRIIYRVRFKSRPKSPPAKAPRRPVSFAAEG